MNKHIAVSLMLRLSGEESVGLNERELVHLTACDNCRGLFHAFLNDVIRERESRNKQSPIECEDH